MNLRQSVIENTANANSRRAYRWAVDDFLQWRKDRPLTRQLIEEYIAHCQKRELSPSSINLAITGAKKITRLEYDNGLITANTFLSIELIHYHRPRKRGFHLAPSVVHEFLNAPDPRTLKGKRDRAILALPFVGLRRSDIPKLTVTDVDTLHEDAKPLVMAWLQAANITDGPVFRRMIKGGRLTAESMSNDSIWFIFSTYSRNCLKTHINPQDGTRTFKFQMRPRPRKLIP